MQISRLLASLALPLCLMGAASPSPAVHIDTLELGPAFRGAQPSVLGMDGAFSLPRADGTALWVFGDTLIGHWELSGKRVITDFPPNSAARVKDTDWATGFAHAQFLGAPSAVLTVPHQAKGRRTWPLDLVSLGGRDWFYYVEIAPHGSGALDFTVTGTGVARWEKTGFVGRGTLWPGDAPSFGASALMWNKRLYLYAGGAETYVARLEGDRPDDLKSYRYWANGHWSADWHQASALPGSGPEVSVRYNRYLGQFVMVYVPPFGKRVEARFASAPEGPWSEPQLVAECQPADATAMFYGAKQHMELASEGDRQIVISYNTNAPADKLEDRPDLYWPHLLRVRFTR